MKNPPSIVRVFTVMRERVIAGEPWQAVLADYGFYSEAHAGQQCVGRVQFYDKPAALWYASKSLQKPGMDISQFRAYRCLICRCWHLTKDAR